MNQNMNKLTVLILAAGYGRRMGPFSRMINKALVPYGNKPLISHIFDRFDKGTKFVIACGNQSQQVHDYISLVHNDKDITLIDVPDFTEGTTGPATTIRYCAEHLPGAFMWISCDTLFNFDYKKHLDHNWIGVCPVDSGVAKDYCWVERDGENIEKVHNKEPSSHAVDAFIGLMYVKDSTFIKALDLRQAKEVYEGFPGLGLKAHTVKMWQDFGTYEKWKQCAKDFPEVSFPKPDELLYIDNGKIVKFTTNPDLATLRYNRAMINPSCMPDNVDLQGQFLTYDKSPGETFYYNLTPDTFVQFLHWAEENLWIHPDIQDKFDIADNFYRKKTLERLGKFRVKYNSWEEPSTVNGVSVKSIDEYIADLDLQLFLAQETKWCFIHGDMQFDNIIYNANTGKFTAIDWRTDFAGDEYGDMYYDLAKMLGGLYLSYKYVKEDKLAYYEDENGAILTDLSVPDVEIYADILRNWMIERNLNWDKVQYLVPIIYLNMAPLHDTPFDKYLIALAQLHFSKL